MSNDEYMSAIFLGMGINPKDKEPYVADPKQMAINNKPFLDQWWDGLSEEQQEKIKNPPHNQRVVSSGFSDDQGRRFDVDPKTGYLIKREPTASPVLIPDKINSPTHYNHGTIEAIVYLKDNMDPVAFLGYLEGNVKKYLHRWRYKGGMEDLKKAQWYLNRWIEEKN